MKRELPLPLKVTLTDPTEPFQLRFAQVAQKLLEGAQKCQFLASVSGLQINAMSEMHLEELVHIVRSHFPKVAVHGLEVVFLEGAQIQEPFVRVKVDTPVEFSGDIIGDLNRRLGWLEDMSDSAIGKLIVAEVPLAEMIGYASALAGLTRQRGTFAYEFLAYKPLMPRNGPSSTPPLQA